MTDNVQPGGGRAAAVLVLATGGTVADAADRAGVSVRTVSRWRQDPAFAEEERAARSILCSRVLGMLADAAPKFVARLIELAAQTDNLPVAASACRTGLDALRGMRGDVDIEEAVSQMRAEVREAVKLFKGRNTR